jgi:dUTP pyrophosphatase
LHFITKGRCNAAPLFFHIIIHFEILMRIQIKRLPHSIGLPLPSRMSSGASGFDVCAATDTDTTIPAGSRALIPTGLCMSIPEGFEVQVRSRSGLAIKNGIMALNSPGTVDADYRGEIKVILANLGSEPFTIKRGDRIAQLVPMKVASELGVEEVSELSETKRGEGGFGSSGI